MRKKKRPSSACPVPREVRGSDPEPLNAMRSEFFVFVPQALTAVSVNREYVQSIGIAVD